MSDVDLWNRIHAAFQPHRITGIDHTPQMALDRIAAKCIGRIGMSFNQSNCSVREEVLPLDDLNRLKTYHKRSHIHTRFEGNPIVVLIYHGERFVIDGNNRVNKWADDNTNTPRLALIIEPREQP